MNLLLQIIIFIIYACNVTETNNYVAKYIYIFKRGYIFVRDYGGGLIQKREKANIMKKFNCTH
jgi:hypothetical protein